LRRKGTLPKGVHHLVLIHWGLRSLTAMGEPSFIVFLANILLWGFEKCVWSVPYVDLRSKSCMVVLTTVCMEPFFNLHSRGIICLMLLRVYINSIVVFFSIIKSLFFGGAYFLIPLQAGVFFSSKFIKQIQSWVSSALTSIKWWLFYYGCSIFLPKCSYKWWFRKCLGLGVV
jgi:hypothetical protein